MHLYYSRVAELPMIANTVMAQVLELLLDGSCLQSPLQFGPSKGPWVQIFERSTGSKTPLRPYMGKSPSGTRESWSWKMRSTCLAVGTTSPLPRWSVNHLKTEVLRLLLLHHARLNGDPPAGVAVRALGVVGTHGKIVELLKVGHHWMSGGVCVNAVDH